MDNNELKHHGILGMKWGVRRYQNKDGSLTAAGKNRASTDKAKTQAKRIKADAKEEVEKIKLRNKNQAIVDKAKAEADESIAKAKGPQKTKPISEMTNEELREAINRKQLEKQYRDLTPSENKKGFWKTAGEDVLQPAAIAAGKSVCTKLLKQWGEKMLGLDGDTKEVAKEAGKEVKKELDKTIGKKNKGNKNNKTDDDNSGSNKPDESSGDSGSKKTKDSSSGMKGFTEFVRRGGKTQKEYDEAQARKEAERTKKDKVDDDDVEIIEPSNTAWRDGVRAAKTAVTKAADTPINDAAVIPYRTVGEDIVNRYRIELTGDDFWGE